MNIYRTNGQDVYLLRDDGSAFHWVDAAGCGVEVTGEAAAGASAGPEWRTMSDAESRAWLCMVPKRIQGIPADDWAGMWDVASRRADAAEAEVKRLKGIIANARTTLHPTIELSNASYQEGYRYAAARVLAILGEPDDDEGSHYGERLEFGLMPVEGGK